MEIPISCTDDADADADEKSLQLLLKDLKQQLKAGIAKLVLKDGQMQVMYSGSENKNFDLSQCGRILSPKTNLKEVIESCLSVIDFIKQERAPDGVVLDRTKISPNYEGTYKEGKGYELLDNILGKGINGKIVAVRDKKSGSDHAIKTMMLASFTSNEIRCWTDLEGDNQFPSLYMFNKQDGKMVLHYEILDKAVTISDIIDYHMHKLREDSELLRHFSLYVLHGLLEASSVMHSKNWLHDDFHEKNAMLQPNPDVKIKVRVLDFGTAKKLDENKTIKNDIEQIIRMFTSVYVTQKFDNSTDLKRNWEKKLQVQANDLQLSDEDKEELLHLVKIALDVQLTEDEMELKKLVKCKLQDSLVKRPDIMQKIGEFIFPEKTDSVDSVDSMDCVSRYFLPFKDIFKIG